MNDASPWAALETSLDEQPLFYVEPTDRRPESETSRVVGFKQIAKIAAPSLLIIGIPNAAKRGQWSLNQALKEGLHIGAPDLLVFAPGGLCAGLEFKSGAGKPSFRQVQCLNHLHRLGFPVGIFRNGETAVRFLRAKGFPVAGAVA